MPRARRRELRALGDHSLPMSDTNLIRRPIRARDTKWAASTARWLARAGFSPNLISCLSAVCGAGAGACLAASAHLGKLGSSAAFVLAAAFIQLRLLCNLFDGM